jgi:BirA family biotin operon repressor/biotin-[acetyl-CoA-carboxylase] ligase
METGALALSPFVEKVFHFKSIDSTNTFAKNLESFPEKGVFLVVADRQIAGRGQWQRSFFSDVEGGIYASIVCPIADMDKHFRYNRALSLAICEAVETVASNCPVSIKWPNDIYCSNKKLCGILLESAPKSPRHLVMGFGLNVNIAQEQFPPDLRTIATSLFIESARTIDTAALLHRICDLLSEFLELPDDQAHVHYARRLYETGRRILISGIAGTFLGVLEDGRLSVETKGGQAFISSGTMQFID